MEQIQPFGDENEQPLPTELRDHKLIGNFKGRRECHLAGDWRLIYKLETGAVIFERTGSHSEILGK
jgi:mRNA interferase YafQ